MTDVETFGGQCCPWDTVCNLWSECGVADTFWVKISGIWNQAIMYVKIAGIWKTTTPYVKVAGVWK